MVLAHKQHAARLPFAVPAALIRCASLDDVVRSVTLLGAARQRFSIRSGGHCFADRSNAGPVILDVAELDALSLVGNRAILGPGLTAGRAVTQLAAHDRAIPTGGCIGVALGGYALVGGFGYSGRRLGLLADRVTRFEAVLADGRRVEASATQHPDLFWALRGAGPLGFAVVTAIEVETAAAIGGVSVRAEWPIRMAAAIITRWQCYAPQAPGRINVEVSLLASDARAEAPIVALHGGIADESGEIDADIAGLRQAFGNHGDAIVAIPLTPRLFAEHLVGLRTADGELAWQPSYPFERVGYQATRSRFRRTRLTPSEIETLVSTVRIDRCDGEAREIELIPWGGAYARSETLVVRDAIMLVRHTALGGSRCDGDLQAAMRRWADAAQSSVSETGTQCGYQGYLEPGRTALESSCFDDHRARLLDIKTAYDPNGIYAT